jgi:hypothetical protein
MLLCFCVKSLLAGGSLTTLSTQVTVMLQPTISGLVCLGFKHLSGLRQYFCYCHTAVVMFMWVALSDERQGVSFTIAAGPRQRNHSQVRVRRDSCHIWLSQIRDPPKLESRSPYLYPQEHLYPQALGSSFVAFYALQNYGGGIRTLLHTDIHSIAITSSRYNFGTELAENTTSNISVVACVSLA